MRSEKSPRAKFCPHNGAMSQFIALYEISFLVLFPPNLSGNFFLIFFYLFGVFFDRLLASFNASQFFF